MTVHIFGIRHHGPGSARSLRQALKQLQPDTILIEGPPEAEPVLSLITSPTMQPPVALLIYQPDNPQNSVYYPFTIFSPEWQALHYGLTNNVPVRFMDLPVTHRMAIATDEESKIENPESKIPEDPLALLAEAAGYSDGERWWEHTIEQRQNSIDLFAAILEAMTAVRNSLPPRDNPMEAKREAHMRKTIREAESKGFEKIAIVCGAWHAPALSQLSTAKEDTTLLKGLPKIKVEATWVPWTYSRLSYTSGYGAGIESPGWYHHLWEWGVGNGEWGVGEEKTHNSPLTISWMTRVAHLLREQDLDASSAHVIEAVRLAEALAALRERPLPGLPELNEACQTVFCFGNDLPMRLIEEKLIVSDRLGAVPPETPMVPLQQDLLKQQKKLRMQPDVSEKVLDLDLRKENDLARSHLLHRLNLLDIPWGEQQPVSGKKGSFHEIWRLQWQPELAINLIEAGIWGNTIRDAANNKACNSAEQVTELPTLTNLLNLVILSDLPDAVIYLISRLENLAALTSDITHLMAALPPLANVMRYGNVRQSDTTSIDHVINSLVARICIGLPSACIFLDDDAAAIIHDCLIKVHASINILQNPEYTTAWQQVLIQVADNQITHGLIGGRCCRLLLDAGVFNANELAQRMGLALSIATESAQSAAWIEGFLHGSGLLLLHDENLWQVLDTWVAELSPEAFTALLPLLRRTFSTFSEPERRQMGEKVKQQVSGKPVNSLEDTNINEANASVVLPIVTQLLGLTIRK